MEGSVGSLRVYMHIAFQHWPQPRSEVRRLLPYLLKSMEIIHSLIIGRIMRVCFYILVACSICTYNCQILKVIFRSHVLVNNVQTSLGLIILKSGRADKLAQWVEVLAVLAWNPHEGGRREPTLQSGPLTSTCIHILITIILNFTT